MMLKKFKNDYLCNIGEDKKKSLHKELIELFTFVLLNLKN